MANSKKIETFNVGHSRYNVIPAEMIVDRTVRICGDEVESSIGIYLNGDLDDIINNLIDLRNRYGGGTIQDYTEYDCNYTRFLYWRKMTDKELLAVDKLRAEQKLKDKQAEEFRRQQYEKLKEEFEK